MQIYVIILAFVIFQLSCSHIQKKENLDNKLLVNDQYDLLPKTELSKVQINEDIQILIYMLQNGYGGRKYIPQDEFKNVINDLKAIDLNYTSSKELCLAIEKSLIKIPDMHIGAKIDNNFCSPLRNEKYITGSVGHNILNKDIIWGVEYIKIKKLNIPILSITSFPNRNDQKWDGFLDTVLKLKRFSPSIIIDLRGNGGGDNSKGLEMANYLFGQDAPSLIEIIIKSQTPATFALLANSMKIRMIKLKRHGKKIPEYIQNRYNKEIENFDLAISNKIPIEKVINFEPSKSFDAKKAYTKPIYVLIDKECASSCESTLETLLLHPYVKTIGENTGGFIHFGNIGDLVLPNSQIQVQLATDFWSYKDGRYLEGIGYSPQIKVNSDKDALTETIKILKKDLNLN